MQPLAAVIMRCETSRSSRAFLVAFFYVMLVLLKVINLAVLCLRTDVPPCV
jgi:hypothetical protein